jgi:adenylylsulfate kinase-like enzyme
MTRALLLNGTVGSGKTSVAAAVGDLLRERDEPHAVLDLDALRQAWPSPPGDRFNTTILLANLRAVSANVRAAGARSLVLAGVVETAADREALARAVGVPLTVVRLTADLDLVKARLRSRHRDDPDGLRWHLARSGELADLLAAAGVEDHVVDTTGASVPAVAARVLVLAGH